MGKKSNLKWHKRYSEFPNLSIHQIKDAYIQAKKTPNSFLVGDKKVPVREFLKDISKTEHKIMVQGIKEVQV